MPYFYESLPPTEVTKSKLRPLSEIHRSQYQQQIDTAMSPPAPSGQILADDGHPPSHAEGLLRHPQHGRRLVAFELVDIHKAQHLADGSVVEAHIQDILGVALLLDVFV